jgi:chemotaxis protein methyltransferase CheR
MTDAEGGAPGRRSGGAASLVEGEFVFTGEDFARIAALLHGDAGISLSESKATLVYSRLAKRLRALGLASFREYCALVAGADGVDERQKMLAALTTNVTRFFREPHHFDDLRARILPPLLDAARRGGRVRLWSAACSSGEEPYSLALTILGLMPDAADHDVRILATDIDPEVLEKARAGVYRESALTAVPAELRRRWFVPVESEGRGRVDDRLFGLAEEARRLVSFRELNLIGSWPMRGPFDAIVCRNVVIYFEEETQTRLWGRLAPLLTPQGRLYVGHSERVTGEAAERLRPDGITTYRVRQAGEP